MRVNTVNGMAIRRHPHIIHKGVKTVQPALADANTLRPVACVIRVLLVVAAGLHGHVDAVQEVINRPLMARWPLTALGVVFVSIAATGG